MVFHLLPFAKVGKNTMFISMANIIVVIICVIVQVVSTVLGHIPGKIKVGLERDLDSSRISGPSYQNKSLIAALVSMIFTSKFYEANKEEEEKRSQNSLSNIPFIYLHCRIITPGPSLSLARLCQKN